MDRTTEGTLGRLKSTVANYTLRSDGGGVLINLIKLAVFTYCTMRAKSGFQISDFRFQTGKSINIGAIKNLRLKHCS